MRRRDFLKAGVLVAAAAACDLDPDDDVAEPDPDTAPEADAETPSPSEMAGSLLIVGASVFDGREPLGQRDVLVRDGEIVEVGEGLDAAGASVVDADGATLMPGWIDAHTHTYEAGWLRQSLLFGVTTQLDMFTDPRFADRIRGGTDRADRAYLYSSGYLATTPEGHGTQFGLRVPTLTDPDEAEGWVDDRLAEGSDYIKIVVDDWGDGPLDPAIVEALADAARDRGVLSVAHAMSAETARIAIEAGVDGLAHTVIEPLEDDLVDAAAEREMFMITTLSVLHASGAPGIVLDDNRLADWLHDPDVRHLREADEAEVRSMEWIEAGLEAVARFHDAGLPVLAGTDARNPGVVHGGSMHSEVELLVEAGLDPAGALAAATAAPADVFGLDDRGHIEPGRRADLLLVDGDPLDDITATRDIVRTWKRGIEADRDALFDHTRP